jgi:hypothetical protein
MWKIRILNNIAILFTMVISFFGCQTLSPVPSNQEAMNSDDYRQYSAEVINLKLHSKSSSEFMNGYNNVNKKYVTLLSGFLTNRIKNNIPYKKTFQQPSGNGKPPNLGTNTNGLTKTTSFTVEPTLAVHISVPIQGTFAIEYSPFQNYLINDHWTIDVSVTANEPSTDPFLVLYRVKNGDFYDYRLIQKLQVLGYNDDANGTLNPSLQNYNLGCIEPNYLDILVFAYGSSGTGQMSVKARRYNYHDVLMETSPTQTYDIAINGTAIWSDDYQKVLQDGQYVSSLPSNWVPYWYPGALFITDNLDWGAVNWGSAQPGCTGDTRLWAFNFSTMTGTSNDDYYGYGSACYLDPFENGPYNSGFPRGWHYPSLILLGGYCDGGTMQFGEIIGYKH